MADTGATLPASAWRRRAKTAHGARPVTEYLCVFFGVRLIGMAETVYGLLLVLLIIFLPAGIYGSVRKLLRRRRPAPAAA